MKQIINVGIGQAGIQISDSLIKLYLGEHKLTHSGKKIDQIQLDNQLKQKIRQKRLYENLPSTFQQSSDNVYKPRFLLIDTEPDVINQILKSDIGEIINPNYIFYGQQSANTFARGYYFNNKQFKTNEIYENLLHKITQNCDSLEAFILNHSISGGTGSGSMVQLMQKMYDMFPKILRSNFVVNYQNSSSASIVGCYNTIMGLFKISKLSDSTILMDNGSLNKIAQGNLDIQFPNYQNLNSLISQINSSYTVFERFKNSSLNCTIKDIVTNISSYPNIHYTIPSFAPLIPQDQIYKWGQIYSQDLLLEKCFDKSCQFGNKTKPKIKNNYNMSSIVIGRGNFDVNKLVMAGNKLAKKQKWVDYVKNAMKIGLIQHKSTLYHENDINKQLRNSITCFRSTTQFCQMLAQLHNHFDRLYSRKAFVHWYVMDGIDQNEFMQAREQLAGLQKDYEYFDWNDYDWHGGEQQLD